MRGARRTEEGGGGRPVWAPVAVEGPVPKSEGTARSSAAVGPVGGAGWPLGTAAPPHPVGALGEGVGVLGVVMGHGGSPVKPEGWGCLPARESSPLLGAARPRPLL